MPGPRKKKFFGQLLERYRHELWMSKVQLAADLCADGFEVSDSIVGKYENGTRRPTPHFIHHTCRVMKLRPEQKDALIGALLADTFIAFFEDLLSSEAGIE